MKNYFIRRTAKPDRSWPLLNHLPLREQELLWRMGTELIVPPGTVVASSADGGRQCTLVLSGACIWSEPDVSGRFEPRRRIGPGDILNEEVLSWVSATEDGPGGFRVHAASESRVLVFHRSEFRRLVEQAPRIGSWAMACTAIHLYTWRPRTACPSPDAGGARSTSDWAEGSEEPTRVVARSDEPEWVAVRN
jgi:hypothetical protein